MAYTDHHGTVHEVTITGIRHDFWTCGGTLQGSCLCTRWTGQVSYDPGNPQAEAMTEGFARLKLESRAMAHALTAALSTARTQSA